MKADKLMSKSNLIKPNKSKLKLNWVEYFKNQSLFQLYLKLNNNNIQVNNNILYFIAEYSGPMALCQVT